jgi:hypothetical protein
VGTLGVSVSVSVTAFDPDGEVLKYTWDFGDGRDARVAPSSTTHKFMAAGALTYTVYVDDQSGLSGHNVSRSATATISYTLNLVTGWNLITIILQGGTYDASTLGLSFGDGVVGWNPATQVYDQSYLVGFPSVDFTLQPTVGYWIYAGGARSLSLTGAVPLARQSLDVPLASAGWAALGMSSLNTSRHASDIVKNCSIGSVSGVAMWDAAAQGYITYMPMFPSVDFALVPGQGYWIFASGAVSFAYDP